MNIKSIPLFLLQGALVMTLFVAAPMSANAAETMGEKVSDTAEKIGEYLDDASITTAIKGKFLARKGLDSMDISVTTKDGIVTLTGMVNTDEQVTMAGNIAQETKGVVRVVNSLTVKK